MKAAVLRQPAHRLTIENLPTPEPAPGEVLLKVEACGVCRTDLHIVAGELKPLHDRITPGHQTVGRDTKTHARLGVSWLAGTDGTCPLCRKGLENLCDNPAFTGYSVNGGFAEDAVARADFCLLLPHARRRARRFLHPAPRRAPRHGPRAASLCRHHRVPRAARCRRRTRRSCRPVRLRSVGAPRDRSSQALEM